MTHDALNLGLLPVEMTEGYNLPVVRADAVPVADSLIPFNRAKRASARMWACISSLMTTSLSVFGSRLSCMWRC